MTYTRAELQRALADDRVARQLRQVIRDNRIRDRVLRLKEQGRTLAASISVVATEYRLSEDRVRAIYYGD